MNMVVIFLEYTLLLALQMGGPLASYINLMVKVIQSYVYVKITASFRYHSLLVLKCVTDHAAVMSNTYNM